MSPGGAADRPGSAVNQPRTTRGLVVAPLHGAAMTRAIVYDRCIDAARALCARLRKEQISACAIHPTDFDRTFEEGIPHLLVTELAMPMFSGFELIRDVRRE